MRKLVRVLTVIAVVSLMEWTANAVSLSDPAEVRIAEGIRLCDQADALLAAGKPSESLSMYRAVLKFLPTSPRAKTGVAESQKRLTQIGSPGNGQAEQQGRMWEQPGTQAGQEIAGPDGSIMVWVPPGEFIMGADDAQGDEAPRRSVYLDGYWIHKHEVTVAQYRRFCDRTGRLMPGLPDEEWRDDYPMVFVSWEEASAYAQRSGLTLPTEAQWEKAARGTDGRQYPWGNNWDPAKCPTSMPENRMTSVWPVGSYPRGTSPYGCLDMAGNVWEWCADWYDGTYYHRARDRNPPGPTQEEATSGSLADPTAKMRVLRSGSWLEFSEDDWSYSFRCAFRGRQAPADRSFWLGFRCAKVP